MKKLALIILLFSTHIFAQKSKVEGFCSSSAKSLALSKSMIYDNKENVYHKEESGRLTDLIIAAKNGKVQNYMKEYHYLDEDKKQKALQIFLDDSFEKDEDYIDEDSLDAEKWVSNTKKIFVTYTPFESYNLRITVFCLNNQL